MTDTIIALATPPGKSAIAIVRVSGEAVQHICEKVLGKKLEHKQAKLVSTDIDSFIAIYYKAPNSYTGEDVLELFPHGNPFIVRKLIEAICEVGGGRVRLAERGEFTQMAFFNGKMDLAQSEAVADVLAAQNFASLKNARRVLSGEMSGEIKMLTAELRELSALLELEVDFAEDLGAGDTPATPPNANAYLKLAMIMEHLQNLKKRFRKGSSGLLKVALFGAPNAGKSSLINALIVQDRLLVSELAGTTRDFVEVPLHLPSGDILLIDTAGLSVKSQNSIDELAMKKSRQALDSANLKILVLDVSAQLPNEFEEWAAQADLIIGTHIDLDNSRINDLCGNGLRSDAKFLEVSSVSGKGISQVLERLQNLLFPNDEENEEIWIDNARQITCIEKAEECAGRAKELFSHDPQPVELIAFEVRDARNALYSVTGEITDESILNEIFSRFCIGK
ncbi:tRNA modification GTPase MnmE [Fibrobacterales bacterium]|nr:tRNA modification GTPase MnmE [Fibrobacterales bacterium]